MSRATSHIHTVSRGYTIMELAAVVAVLGILAGFTIPAFLKFQKSSRIDQAKAVLNTSIADCLQTYRTDPDSAGDTAVDEQKLAPLNGSGYVVDGSKNKCNEFWIKPSDPSEESFTARKNLLMAVETIFHIARSGDKVRTRLCRETDCMGRLVSALSYGQLDESVNEEVEEFKERIRRTAAVTIGLLYEVKDNQKVFEEFEAEIFEACSAHYEVAYFLSSLLLILPLLEASTSTSQ